ncbi:MAG: NUDIX hydrolase [candidate division Zixibacteria bacterium]|nr:NUDIX hydrolase [candidate division Zixibacteria bacterium]
MYVTEEMVTGMIDRFGKPQRESFRFAVTGEEFDRIKGSQKHGRSHDATFYVIHKGQIVVIAKHFYPPGLYRAPSGGLQPDEPFEDGIKREAMEETGCEIAVDKYLLRTDATFVCTRDNETVENKWYSHVFQARYVSGDFNFTDKHEIREVRLATLDDFETFSAMMRESNVGGFHYRAALHDTIKGLLKI